MHTILVQIFSFVKLCSLNIECLSNITTKYNHRDILWYLFSVFSNVFHDFNCIMYVNIGRASVYP